MDIVDLPLVTVADEIQWPPLPDFKGASKLAVLFQLEQSQWWPAEKITDNQFMQLAKLVSHAVTTVPYYKSRLPREQLTGTELADVWHQIPVLRRSDIQNAGEQLYTNHLPKLHGNAVKFRTSGSTGKPIETLSTDVTQFFWDIFTLRDHFWHKRDFSKNLAVIRFSLDKRTEPPHGMETAVWGRSTHGLMTTGHCYMLSILASVSDQIDWLVKVKPDYLLTHPSVLAELVDACEDGRFELPSLCEVRTISEALPAGLRQRCRDVLGVNLVDVYSTIELGYLAIQCPEHDHYHVQSEGVYLEVLDDNDKPCKPGEIGRVVVTSLHNFAFPLIRYEVGDYAEVGEPCPCGRGLPVLKRIIGRFRNILTTPDGERRYPRLGTQDLHEIAPVLQMQVFQNSLTEIEVHLVLGQPLTGEQESRLTLKFTEMLGDCFNFTFREVDTIPRSASGKFEEFISRL